MVIEVLSLDGHVDVSGMDRERMLSSHIENVGMPVDINVLSDVGQVHGEMHDTNGLVDGDIGSMEVFDELVDDGSTVD